jgi:hemerythrin-like domain-containing protein
MEFISGIHNYCDRWCEKCNFTSRCQVFEKTSDLTSEQLDKNNNSLWETLSKNLSDLKDKIYQDALKHGIDLSVPFTEEEDKENKAREDNINHGINESLLIKLSENYQNIAKPFIDDSDGIVDLNRQLIANLHLGITTEEDVVYIMADIGTCLDILQWYLYFIQSKLTRALHGKLEGEEWEEKNGFPKDSDGSAKIALVAIDKNMSAWAQLYKILPSSQDKSLEALSLLEQLKNKILLEFPEAMQFKRPGFDD